MKEEALFIALVLVSLVVLTNSKMRNSQRYRHREQLCYPTAEPGEPCDTDKCCAYNKKGCPGFPYCRLVCTNNPYKVCYGLGEGDLCKGTSGDSRYECWPDGNGELVCISLDDICQVE